MNLLEAMEQRHSVRSYAEKEIEEDVAKELKRYIDECNHESGLHMQLVLNDSEAFQSRKSRAFTGVSNYIVMVGPPKSDEVCGYYGEKVVLKAQQLGLNTCWVASSFDKKKGIYRLNEGEQYYLVIALGYGTNPGKLHKSKSREAVTNNCANAPEWFWKGIDAALLAPTGLNMQKFTFSFHENQVSVKAGMTICSKLSLGIVKCHFEIGAECEKFHL